MQRIAALAALVPLVAAHGFIESPTPRKPGDAFKAACGEQPYYQQSSDINGNVQGIMQVVGSDMDGSKCKLWQCKGFQFDDNKDNVQSYSLGEKIDFTINIAAPHTGYANVSVVKTSTDTIIGSPLIEFSHYAANSGVDANNTAFSVTLPESLSGDCTTAGDCVLQWFWDAPDIDQTYESCVDFTVGGGSGSDSGSGSGSGSDASSSSSPAASAPAATSTSAAAAVPTVTDVAVTPSAPAAEPTTGAGDEDDECPADEDDEDDEAGDEDDDECPADDEDVDDETGEDEDDDEECPADQDEADEEVDETSSAAATAAPTGLDSQGTDFGSGSGSGSNSGSGSGSGSSKAVTSYITVTASPETVTVTAQPAACTQA